MRTPHDFQRRSSSTLSLIAPGAGLVSRPRFRKGLIGVALGALLSVSSAWAEDLNLKETPETTSVALSPLSFGATVGGLVALNDDLRNESETFLELGANLSVQFAEHFMMGAHYEWLLPTSSQGGGLTLDYLFGQGHFRPLIGANLGMHYIDTHGAFGDGFGISGGAHAGLVFDVLDQMQLRIRVPFLMVGNQNSDQLAGVDFTVLFSGPHRHAKVKKLTY